ncbi:MAG: Gfo/Idh/MocA family oxidoreductase [Chloroflexota bacterium]
MEPLRLGVIGPGLIWSLRHEPALQALSDTFRIVAFCASSERRRAEIAQAYPGAPFETDYQSFVRRGDLDGVLVLTPIPLNAPVSIEALGAGKHVFLEKPMARSLEEGLALVRQAERANRRLVVLEQDGYQRRWQMVRDLLNAPEIGRLVSYEFTINFPFDDQAHDHGGYGRTAWRQKPDFPLGTLFDGGHHQMAMLATIFGKATSVYASGVNLRPEYGVYDHVFIHMVHASGLRGMISYSNYLGGNSYFFVRGTQGMLAIERDRVTVAPYQGAERMVELPRESTHDTMWGAIARAMQAGEEVAYGPQDAFRELVTLLAIERAIVRDQAVEIE